MRHWTFDALVLKQIPWGDRHRMVWFFTRELGLLSALAHGAAQSRGRLKLLTSPFRQVELKAFHEPVGDLWKVVDLGEKKHFPGLSETLERFESACRWVEWMMKATSVAEPQPSFDLFASALDLAQHASLDQLRALEVQVVWRVLADAGLHPEFLVCDGCGRRLSGSMMAWRATTAEVLCEACQTAFDRPIETAAVERLLATSVLGLEEAGQAPWPLAHARSLIEAGLDAWEHHAGRRWKSRPRELP